MQTCSSRGVCGCPRGHVSRPVSVRLQLTEDNSRLENMQIYESPEYKRQQKPQEWLRRSRSDNGSDVAKEGESAKGMEEKLLKWDQREWRQIIHVTGEMRPEINSITCSKEAREDEGKKPQKPPGEHCKWLFSSTYIFSMHFHRNLNMSPCMTEKSVYH